MDQNKQTSNPVNEALKLPLNDAFEADLTAKLEEAGEVGIVSIAMIDLDNFHPVNVDFGHGAGDKVLIETGTYLRDALPEGAVLYRYAGDAFAIIFDEGQEKEEAFLLMEAIRAGFPVKRPDDQPITITVGIATAPEDGGRYYDLVRKADGAMFRGKVNNRNRVYLAREEKMVTKTSHYTVEQLQRLTKLSKREGIGEAILLREALDSLLKKYDV